RSSAARETCSANSGGPTSETQIRFRGGRLRGSHVGQGTRVAYPVADAREERRRIPADAELPLDVVRSRPGGADRAGVEAVEVVGSADGDAIAARVGAAA